MPFEITSQAALKVHLASVHGFNDQNGKLSDEEKKSQHYSNPESEQEMESEDSQEKMDTQSFNENYYEEEIHKKEGIFIRTVLVVIGGAASITLIVITI